MAQRFVYILLCFAAILTARPRGERYPFYAPRDVIYRHYRALDFFFFFYNSETSEGRTFEIRSR